MKIQRGQEQLQTVRVDATNPRMESFNGHLTGFSSESHNRRSLHTGKRHGPGSDFLSETHLSRFVEVNPCTAVIEERHRMAREIHDTLVQEFAGILLHLEAAKSFETAGNGSECLARAKELARCGLEDARRMLLGLRPKSLEGAHLSDALAELAEGFSRDCGISCTFNANGRSHELTEEIENELYRVAQEALCNVRKHSRAGSVSILLSYGTEGVVLGIKDNGQGFATSQHHAGAHGFGLPAMYDRANRLGGKMDINTGKGTGTEVRMSVPLPGQTSKERNNQ